MEKKLSKEMGRAERTVQGVIGRIERDKIFGWACEQENKSPIEVTLFINDIKIKTTQANAPRKTIAEARNLPSFLCGYSFELQYPISNEDKIVVKAGKSKVSLPINRKAQKALEAFPKNKDESGIGHVDMVSSNNIRGWAFDQNNFYQPSSLDILVNGKKIDSCKAVQRRPDLITNKNHPTGVCGFEYVFDKSLALNDKVNVLFSKSKVNLKNSPISVAYPPDEGLRVLLIGLPKTGTTILTYRIEDAFPFKPKIYFEPGGPKGLDDAEIHKVGRHENFSITKSLFFPLENTNKNCDNICKLYDKVVWIVRDPRDQFLSNFFYRWYYKHDPSPVNFKKSYDLTVEKEPNPSSIPFYKLHEHCINAKNYFRYAHGQSRDQIQKLKSDVFILKYEDFVDNKIEPLNQYLELEINDKVEVHKDFKRVARTKKYGNWRNWFTPEDVAFYKPMLSDYLTFFGYDPDDWKLNNPKKLNSKEGSEYMLKMFTKPGK